jgi:PEP-CTERM/exosortase A-associated glycosyltransferase
MPEKLTILHVFDHSLPHQDGYSTRSVEILSAQRRKGWEPIALTSPKHEVDCGDKGAIEERIKGFTFYRCGASKAYFLGINELMLMARIGRRLAEIVKKRQPDILHVHSPVLNAIPAIIVGKLFRIPLIYEIRAFWEDAGADQGTYRPNSPKYRLVRTIETLCCRLADHVTVICHGLRNDLLARGIRPGRISTIYNAIHPENFSDATPDAGYRKEWRLDGCKVIGFIGSFYRYEGLDAMIDAFAMVAVKQKDIVLLLVGGGETEDELRQQVVRLGLADRVVMPGRVSHQRVPGVYALMDLLVYPRYSVKLTELVTPLKPLEAMAMGKPVIATDIGGHRELIQDGVDGELVAPNHSQALANAMLALMNNPKKSSQLAKNGLKKVRRAFNWDATTTPYAAIFERLASRSTKVS